MSTRSPLLFFPLPCFDASSVGRAPRRAGRVYQVLRVQSQRPEALRDAVRLYLSVMHAPGELTRAEREMLAVVVSAENECHY